VGLVLLVLTLVFVRVSDARDASQVRAFRADHPCPATGHLTGACPGWVVDHKYPLCAGGKDEPVNMQWEQRDQSFVKDRIERELCACKGKH
jgi:hypothetical protein